MDKDLNKYRLPWEHEDHWKLRKKFLICHQNSFSKDQLLCLSQTYMNIKVLGCKYSKEVMLRIAELNKAMENSVYEEEEKEEEEKSSSTAFKRKYESENDSPDISSEHKISKICDKIPESFKKFSQIIRKFQKTIENPVEIINISITKIHMKVIYSFDVVKEGFMCTLYINDLLISNGCGWKKKQAQREACKKAIQRICSENITNKPLQKSKEENESSLILNHKKLTMNQNKPFQKHKEQDETSLTTSEILYHQNLAVNQKTIVILDDLYIDPSRNSFQVMTRTAAFNNLPLVFKYFNLDNGEVRCDLMFNKSPLAFAKGISKQNARNTAADIALEELKKHAYTVMIKQHSSTEQIVSREKLEGCILGNAITESNVGYKLLQKMGWNNNDSTNSAVFSKNKDSFKREGLGFSESGGVLKKKFINQLEKIIANYASSETDADLVFSSEFTKDERKEIHRLAQTYSLKSVSRGGKGPERHSVLSRRFKPYQLLKYLISSGGQTTKYELLMPNNDS